MPPRVIGKLRVMIMNEYQDIEGFYDYVTNTWRDYLILYYGIIMISKV